MKIDTGVEANSVPHNVWERIEGRPMLTSSHVTLRAFGGASVEHVGKAKTLLNVNNRSVEVEVFITKEKTVPVLGLHTCVVLGLVQIRAMPLSRVFKWIYLNKPEPITLETLQKPPMNEVFEGLGKFAGQHHMTRDKGSQGYGEPMHRVPDRLVDPLKQKLDEMESAKVIKKVEYPTDFVNNLVITHKKNGAIRTCLDPKHLNQPIKREHFPIQTFVDVASQLGWKRLFTIIDLKDSYWQRELDDESADLTTFSTPFGH